MVFDHANLSKFDVATLVASKILRDELHRRKPMKFITAGPPRSGKPAPPQTRAKRGRENFTEKGMT